VPLWRDDLAPHAGPHLGRSQGEVGQPDGDDQGEDERRRPDLVHGDHDPPRDDHRRLSPLADCASELLEAVRDGSDAAFRRIVDDHRGELHAHCYRMLGSLHDAEGAVQETLLRAWRALPEFGGRSSQSQQETLRSVGDARTRELVEAYVDAWSRADVDALRALLAEDVVFSMPPWPSWWRGRETIVGFSTSTLRACHVTRSVPTRANGQHAVASYGLDPETARYTASAIVVYTLEAP
jgi:SnoaL-like domain/Sigma-70 region 2